jgi:hypothetical protein
MYGRDEVGLALYALEEGMGARGAAGLAGCGVTAVGEWSGGRLPHSVAGCGSRRGGRARSRPGRRTEAAAMARPDEAEGDAGVEDPRGGGGGATVSGIGGRCNDRLTPHEVNRPESASSRRTATTPRQVGTGPASARRSERRPTPRRRPSSHACARESPRQPRESRKPG